MADTPPRSSNRSKLRFEFNRAATEANKHPHIKGRYQHDGHAEPMIEAAFWMSAATATGPANARGRLTFASMSASLDAIAAAKANPPTLPPGIDLQVGECLLFRDPKGKGRNGEPHWYGYAHEGNRITRLDAYEYRNLLLGGVRVWRPKREGGSKVQSDAKP